MQRLCRQYQWNCGPKDGTHTLSSRLLLFGALRRVCDAIFKDFRPVYDTWSQVVFSAHSGVELWVGTRGLVASIKCAATNLIFSLKGKAIALAAGAEAVSP